MNRLLKNITFLFFNLFLFFGLSFAESSSQSNSYVHIYSSSNGNSSSVNVEVNCVNGVCNTNKTVTGDPNSVSTNIIVATSSPDISNYVDKNVQQNIDNINSNITNDLNSIKIPDPPKIPKIQPAKNSGIINLIHVEASSTPTINHMPTTTLSGSVIGGIPGTTSENSINIFVKINEFFAKLFSNSFFR